MSDSAAPWTAACEAPLSSTVSQSLLKFMTIESVMLSSYHILCHPLYLFPSIFPRIRVFSNKSALWVRWPKDQSFSFSNSPSSEYSGSISFRIDWFDLFAVQETLKSLLQHHNLKASVLQCSAFFIHTRLLELINSISYRIITINSISKCIFGAHHQSYWCLSLHVDFLKFAI